MSNEQPEGVAAPEPLRDYQLRKLLTRRQKLADAGVELLCHDLPGADLLWQAVHQVEECLRAEFPDVWAQSYAGWIADDSARLHSPDQPAPYACWICRQRQPPRAGIRPAS
ncbi:hypothetical protein [Geodermatophilus sp. SYSU D00710]